jgi:hypothetical protein
MHIPPDLRRGNGMVHPDNWDHNQFFNFEVTIPTCEDLDCMMKGVLSDLQKVHPDSLAGGSVIAEEIKRRLARLIDVKVKATYRGQ